MLIITLSHSERPDIVSILRSGRQTAYHTCIKLLYRKCVIRCDPVADIVTIRSFFSFTFKIILILVRDLLQYCYRICNCDLPVKVSVSDDEHGFGCCSSRSRS